MKRKGFSQTMVIFTGLMLLAAIFAIVLINYYTGFINTGVEVVVDSFATILQNIGTAIPFGGG